MGILKNGNTHKKYAHGFLSYAFVRVSANTLFLKMSMGFMEQLYP